MSTIKISELGNLATVTGNVFVPLVSNVTGIYSTVKANIDVLAQYITDGTGNVRYGNIIPRANVTYNLGNLTYRWKDLYLSGSTIYLGNTSITTDSGGTISVSAIPTDIYNGTVTTNNLSPSNVALSCVANGGGTLSASMSFNSYVDGEPVKISLYYGNDYIISGTTLNVLLNSNYMINTYYWPGFGSLHITESGTSTVIGNTGVSTDSIVTPDGNLTVSGNLSTTGNITGPTISDLYANVATANTGLKSYVDFGNTIVTSLITTSNSSLKSYVDGQISAANAAITAANVGLKGYVDQGNTIQASAISAANVGIIGYIDRGNTIVTAGITSANVGMKGYVDETNVALQSYINSRTTSSGFVNVTIASANAVGTAGNVVYDLNYVYFCVSANSWIRTARASW